MIAIYILLQYENKCISLKDGGGIEQSKGPLIGPPNDIHNERKFDYVDNFDSSRIMSHNSSFQNNVLPLQNYTNEKYQVSYSDSSGHVATGTSSYANLTNNLRGDYLSIIHIFFLLLKIYINIFH